MEKYIQVVKELYTEPKDEKILGSYLHAEASGVDLPIPLLRNAPVRKRRKKLSDVQMKDIRNFLNRNQTQTSNQNHSSSKDVTTEKLQFWTKIRNMLIA